MVNKTNKVFLYVSLLCIMLVSLMATSFAASAQEGEESGNGFNTDIYYTGVFQQASDYENTCDGKVIVPWVQFQVGVVNAPGSILTFEIETESGEIQYLYLRELNGVAVICTSELKHSGAATAFSDGKLGEKLISAQKMQFEQDVVYTAIAVEDGLYLNWNHGSIFFSCGKWNCQTITANWKSATSSDDAKKVTILKSNMMGDSLVLDIPEGLRAEAKETSMEDEEIIMDSEKKAGDSYLTTEATSEEAKNSKESEHAVNHTEEVLKIIRIIRGSAFLVLVIVFFLLFIFVGLPPRKNKKLTVDKEQSKEKSDITNDREKEFADADTGQDNEKRNYSDENINAQKQKTEEKSFDADNSAEQKETMAYDPEEKQSCSESIRPVIPDIYKNNEIYFQHSRELSGYNLDQQVILHNLDVSKNQQIACEFIPCAEINEAGFILTEDGGIWPNPIQMNQWRTETIVVSGKQFCTLSLDQVMELRNESERETITCDLEQIYEICGMIPGKTIAGRNKLILEKKGILYVRKYH